MRLGFPELFLLRLGFPELFLLAIPVALIGLPLVGILVFRTSFGLRARRFGYGSRGEYLRAAPRSDDEKRDAVDLASKGLAICLLGLIFPPFILIGLIPLFYGGRKVAFASMGLGLVDDAEQPGA